MDDDLNEASMSLATLVVAGLTIAILLLWVTSAEPVEVCLTKKEARQLWPKQHIYWYSKDRCWSNRRGPPRNLKFDPVFSKAHAEEVKQNPGLVSENKNRPGSGGSQAVIKIVKPEDYNELDAAADSDTYFRAEPFPLFGSLVVQENFEMEWKIRIEGHLR